MEGASFFYSAMISETNCLQIRSVSNRVESRNRDNWDIPLAVKNLNTFALELLDELNAKD